MSKYEIPESSDLGQRLLTLSAMAGDLIEHSVTYGDYLTKGEIIESLNEIIRTAKAIRNKLTLPVWKDDIEQYKVI